MRSAPVLACLFLGACASARAQLVFGAPEPWSEPIADYLAAGEREFPGGFQRGITTLTVFANRLWIGYGDATQNMGTRVPIELRYFANPDDNHAQAAAVLAEGAGAPQRTPTDTGEEQIEPYRVCAGTLCLAGVDSNDPDELWSQAKREPRPIEGNVFRLEERDGAPAWRKFRSIPGGEHVHDLAELDGILYAVGSGAADRVEWEEGRVFRYLWESHDGGTSFVPLHRVQYPDLGQGDTRFRKLLAVGDTLYAFGYVNPYVDGGPLAGRHVRVRAGEVAELAELGELVVARTFPLDRERGLVVTRDEQGRTRTFLAREKGFAELDSWVARRVIDVAPARTPGEFLLLSGDGATSETFAVERFRIHAPERLDPVLTLSGVAPTALALWHGQLYLGTDDGRVLRARPRPH